MMIEIFDILVKVATILALGFCCGWSLGCAWAIFKKWYDYSKTLDI